jgi:Low affinity iron permease
MLGHPSTFGVAVLVIVVWVMTGLLFHFSDTWQLVITTGPAIVTFLMVFLIQNSQNRDSECHLSTQELEHYHPLWERDGFFLDLGTADLITKIDGEPGYPRVLHQFWDRAKQFLW